MKRLPRRSANPLLYQCLFHPQRRFFSPSQRTSSAQSINDLQTRAPKLIPDYLTPMPSHLLSTTITDLLHTQTPSSPQIQDPPRVLPQGHHLVYFPIQTAPSHLAPDGADLDHSPGPEFPRRMWAGGEVVFHKGWKERLVMDGRAWMCKEEIGDVRLKGGQGQEKVFVDVWRRYAPGHGESHSWDIEERRTLVFMRDEKEPSAVPRRLIKFPHKPTSLSAMVPTPTHLFHFSALTFNAHSIHIDPLYARSTDGHKDLLVHGPLTLALMLNALGGSVERITYRNHAPLYVNEELTVCVREQEGRSWDVWVEGPEGGLAVKGTAVMDA